MPRRDVLVWHISMVGDPVLWCPVWVEVGTRSAWPGEVISIWDSVVLLGPVEDGLGPVKL